MVVGFIALITVPLLGGSAAGAESAAAIPDFSGIWAHLTFPDVEPPLKGAGPVRNLSRVTAELARTLAPYNGAATVGASPNGVSNLSEPLLAKSRAFPPAVLEWPENAVMSGL